MKRYENLEEAMCKELDKLNKKYGTEQAEMSMQDAERADLLYHALKSAATYHAMKDSYEGGQPYRDGMEGSYARGRDSRGRYMSREMDGYSGHYPEWPPYYPRY